MELIFDNESWLIFTLIFAVGWIVSFGLTFIVYKLAIRFNILEYPNHRTIHAKAVPKLGGIAIYLTFLFGAAILNRDIFPVSLLLGSTLILLLGIFDDIKGTNCYQKLVVQFVAAGIVVWGGFYIESMTLSSNNIIYFGWIGIPMTMLWIAGISNAVNLIDGLDGLAAGISLGISMSLFVISLLIDNMELATASILLAGILAGFLIFNFHPAKIFMGDCGSLLIGFLLAYFAMKTANVFILIILFGIPITDTLLAIVRRLVRGVHPFKADKEHVHHLLLKKGLSHRGAVVALIFCSILLALMAILTEVIDDSRFNFWATMTVIAAILWGVHYLYFQDYFKLKIKTPKALYESKLNNN